MNTAPQDPSARFSHQGLTLLFVTSALLMSGFTGGSCAGPVDPPRPLQPSQPPACERLDDNACAARGDCTAVYEQACACPDCGPDLDCFPCDCVDPSFVSCHPNDPCAGLSESACNATPSCAPQYMVPPCPAIACAPGERCIQPTCPDVAEFYACASEPPPPPVCSGVTCTLYCEYGFATGEDGCEICACNEPPPPPICGDVICTLACEYGFATGEDGCEICACNQPPPPPLCEPVLCELYCENGFATDEFGCETCACNPSQNECETDSDCPGGYCEHFATCAGLDCPPPPPNACIFTSCDDGSEVVCDAIPPDCGPGRVAAVRNGCFACLDARTCR